MGSQIDCEGGGEVGGAGENETENCLNWWKNPNYQRQQGNVSNVSLAKGVERGFVCLVLGE